MNFDIIVTCVAVSSECFPENTTALGAPRLLVNIDVQVGVHFHHILGVLEVNLGDLWHNSLQEARNYLLCL